MGTPVLRSLSDGDNRRIFVSLWNFSFRDAFGTLVEEGVFLGGGGVRWGAFVYSSFLEKQMRKIYDQFGTTPSNKTQTLKFPLLRFVSSNPLQKKI